MSRYHELLEYIGEVAEEFGDFRVVATNRRDSGAGGLAISDVLADSSDNEICLISSANDQVSLTIKSFYLALREILDRYPEYSLVVSEWFQIDNEHMGRADQPLDSVEINQAAKQFVLYY